MVRRQERTSIRKTLFVTSAMWAASVSVLILANVHSQRSGQRLASRASCVERGLATVAPTRRV